MTWARRRRRLRRAANGRRVTLRTMRKNNPPAFCAFLAGLDEFWFEVGRQAGALLFRNRLAPVPRP